MHGNYENITVIISNILDNDRFTEKINRLSIKDINKYHYFIFATKINFINLWQIYKK